MPEVTIVLKTIDQSSEPIKKNKKELEGLIPGLEKAGKGLGNFVAQNATLIGVLAGTGAALKSSYDAFQNYAGAVRDLAAVSGTGAEEASKLLQVLDDYQLTAQDVTAATRFMTKAGLTPTIETLAQLSDQYNAINDPMEKNAFIMKNLGKGGLQWVNVLKQGGAALREQSEEANKALILTDEQIRKSEMARLAMDSWADSWEGLKVSIGSAIGEMIAGAAATEDLREQFDKLGLESEAATGRMNQGTNPAFERFRNMMEKGAAMTDYYNNQLRLTGQATEDTTESTADAEAAARNYWGVIQDVSGSMQDFSQQNEDLNKQLAELQDKQSQENPWTQAYKDLGAEIESTKGAIQDLAAEEEKANQARLFGLIAAKAEMDGFRSISVEALTQLGEQWGVLAEGSTAAATTAISQAEAWTAALEMTSGELQSINDYYLMLKKLSKTGIVITADVVFNATGGAMGGQNTSGTCFTGDTLITLADSSTKRIKDIVPGDKVLSWDTDNWTPVTAEVEAVYTHAPHEVGKLLLINGFLKVTDEHLLFDGKEWKPAGFFEVGHNLVNIDGSLMRVTSVRELVIETVYNLHTNHATHNYFANGVLAHNAKSVDVFSNAGGGQLGGQWALVGDLPGGAFVDGVSELVGPDGRVYDSKTSKKMLSSGMLGPIRSLAFGGDVYDTANPTTKGGILKAPGGPKGGAAAKAKRAQVFNDTVAAYSGGGNAVFEQVADLSQSVDQQMQSVQVAQQMMAQQTQALTGTLNNKLDELIGVMTNANPRAVGQQVFGSFAANS